MSFWKIRLSLFLNFFVYAILLNTVGIVILQVISEYGVSRVQAGSLEAYKDLSIMLVSFLIASYIPRFGYKRSMVFGLFVVTLACVLVASVTGFWVTPILYMCVGATFAIIKVSVYSTVGLITENQKEHTSLMNTLEGIFMVGSLTGPLIFSFMIDQFNWQLTYGIMAVATALALLLLLSTRFNESDVSAQEEQASIRQMLTLIKYPMVWMFVACAFLYVMIEQSFGTWLPTFNREIFQLSESQSAAFLSIYAGSIALSRFLAGFLAKRFSWLKIQLTYLALAFALTLFVLMITFDYVASPVANWQDAPALAYIFSMVGFFLGPIYPTICSIVLSKLEKFRQSAMTGLIVIFSALGGTTGSLMIGFFSQNFSTHNAFFFPLVPITLLALALMPYKKLSDKFGEEHHTD